MAAAKWLGYWLLASAWLQLSGWAIGFWLRLLAWLQLSGWAIGFWLRLLAWLWLSVLASAIGLAVASARFGLSGLALAGGLASARLLRLGFG